MAPTKEFTPKGGNKKVTINIKNIKALNDTMTSQSENKTQTTQTNPGADRVLGTLAQDSLYSPDPRTRPDAREIISQAQEFVLGAKDLYMINFGVLTINKGKEKEAKILIDTLLKSGYNFYVPAFYEFLSTTQTDVKNFLETKIPTVTPIPDYYKGEFMEFAGLSKNYSIKSDKARKLAAFNGILTPANYNQLKAEFQTNLDSHLPYTPNPKISPEANQKKVLELESIRNFYELLGMFARTQPTIKDVDFSKAENFNFLKDIYTQATLPILQQRREFYRVVEYLLLNNTPTPTQDYQHTLLNGEKVNMGKIFSPQKFSEFIQKLRI
jgi:hypothetical protein